jgi:hypothetical protein
MQVTVAFVVFQLRFEFGFIGYLTVVIPLAEFRPAWRCRYPSIFVQLVIRGTDTYSVSLSSCSLRMLDISTSSGIVKGRIDDEVPNVVHNRV